MLITKRISVSAENVQDILETMDAFDLSYEIQDPEPSVYDEKLVTPIEFTGDYEGVIGFMMWQLSISREMAEKMVGGVPPGVPEEAGDIR